MKRKNVKGMLALLLAAGTVLTACGQTAGTESSTEKTAADTTKETVKARQQNHLQSKRVLMK